MRKRHPNKHIEEALQYVEQAGWSVEASKKGHAWGRIYCPLRTREGHKFSIWSTPRNPENFARTIRRWIDQCEHEPE